MEKNKRYYEFEVPGNSFGDFDKKNIHPGEPGGHPANEKLYQYGIINHFLLNYPKYKKFAGRVRVTIIAQFKIPVNITQEEEKKMLEEKVSPLQRPDMDNISKRVLHSLKNFAYKDDSQVTELIVQKVYNKLDKIYIKVEEY